MHIRPYCNGGDFLVHNGEYDDVCGGSPLIQMSGRIHREGEIYTLVLPSLNRFLNCFYFVYSLSIQDVGEIHRVVLILILRSPLSEPVLFCVF